MVRRIVGLVSQLTASCHSTVTLRGMADVASRALTGLFPESSVVVFERDVHGDALRAVAGANIPGAWRMRAVRPPEVPLIASALRHPDRLVYGSAAREDGVGNVDPLPLGPLQVICGAVPDATAPLYVLMFLAPAVPAEAVAREIAIETTRHLLAASSAIAAGDATRSRTLSAIHHAKIEWERVADGLPEIVGLVNRRGRVVRVSRGVERWSLGNVRDAIGRDLHDVLHPDCRGAGCALHLELDAAMHELARSPSATFELTDPLLNLDLVVELKGASDAGGEVSGPPWHRVAFIISNVTALRRAERELTALNHTLEARVSARTADLTASNRTLRGEVARRRDAEESLRATQRELEALSERLMNAQEEERKRIAQDLHDSVGQSLSAIKYSLEHAQVLARRQDLTQSVDVVEAAVKRVQRVMDEVRGISMNLRPALLDDLGAASAVRYLCREWHDVYRDIAIDTDIAVADADIPAMLGTNVYRAVQESLNNVARHAGAQHVQVSMRVESGTLAITVQDDGTGFSMSDDVRPLIDRPELRGLRGLCERAERTGGRCHVASAPGCGTTVRLEWPVALGQAAREMNTRLN